MGGSGDLGRGERWRAGRKEAGERTVDRAAHLARADKIPATPADLRT
jgi:hypothetical protein